MINLLFLEREDERMFHKDHLHFNEFNMKAKYQNADAIISMWNYPPNCPAPVFPLIYFEWLKGVECRGFLQLQDITGDIDFVGYSLENDDILIDSLGRVFDLTFDEFIYPKSVITTWSEDELKQNIIPALEDCGNKDFAKEVLDGKEVGDIIMKMATFFSW